jgi:transglutaminase-like putative cysteine protease
VFLLNSLESLLVDLPEDISRLVASGYFDEAENLIEIYLTRNIAKILKDRLIFEKHRIKRLKEDYIYSFEEALELGKSKIENFSREELEYLKKERYADWILINGKVAFSSRFLENSLKVHPSLKNRLLENSPDNRHKELLHKTIDDIVTYGEKKYFIHVKAGIKLNNIIEKIGEKVKVHIPLPRNAQQISNIKIINTSHEPKEISSSDYPQRTIYFEEKITGEDIFTIEYSYENHIKYKKLDSTKVSKTQPKFYTNEWLPHIKFSPFLVELTKEIIKDEKNPLLKARKIYDYITENVQYSFMRQYAAITSVAEYGAYNLKGDCGIQALLFITLCRIADVPARWQSGLHVDPYFIGCHDWAEFYIEPYGWLLADPSYGGDGIRNGNKKVWDFYFGNLDPFRMVANSEFHYPLYPEKKYLRQDPYDNQLGEVELLNGPFYEWKRILEIIDVHEIN